MHSVAWPPPVPDRLEAWALSRVRDLVFSGNAFEDSDQASGTLIRTVSAYAQHTFDDCVWRGRRFSCEYTNTSVPALVEGAPLKVCSAGI